MLFKLRRLLILASAVLVVVTGAQASLDTPHDPAPAVAAVETLVTLSASTGGEDRTPAPPEDPGGLQHEHSTSVDHAMMAADAIDAGRPDGAAARFAGAATLPPAGRPHRAPDRPPRTIARA